MTIDQAIGNVINNDLLLKSATMTRPFFNPKAVSQVACGHTDIHVTVTLKLNKPFNTFAAFRGMLNTTTLPSSETLTTLSSPAKAPPSTFSWFI